MYKGIEKIENVKKGDELKIIVVIPFDSSYSQITWLEHF